MWPGGLLPGQGVTSALRSQAVPHVLLWVVVRRWVGRGDVQELGMAVSQCKVRAGLFDFADSPGWALWRSNGGRNEPVRDLISSAVIDVAIAAVGGRHALEEATALELCGIGTAPLYGVS